MTEEIKLRIASHDSNNNTNLVGMVEDVTIYWRASLFENKLPSYLVYTQMVDELYQSLHTNGWNGNKNQLFDIARSIEHKHRKN